MVDDSRVLAGVVDDLLLASRPWCLHGSSGIASILLLLQGRSAAAWRRTATAGVRLVYRNPGGSAEVMGSEAALAALTALTDNALQHEHAGGRVELAVRRDGQNVIAAVTDDGSGIDAPTMETLLPPGSPWGQSRGTRGRASLRFGLALVPRDRRIARGTSGVVDAGKGHDIRRDPSRAALIDRRSERS